MPISAEPLKNSTLVTVPSASAAAAVSVMFEGAVRNLVPLVGLTILTVGAALGYATTTVIGLDVVARPRLSVATAVMLYEPFNGNAQKKL